MGLLDVHTENRYETLWWEDKVSPSFAGTLLKNSRNYSLSGDFGMMLFQEVSLKEYAVWLSYYGLKKSRIFWGTASVPVVELHILLNNIVEYHLKPHHWLKVKTSQFNITFSPYLDNEVHFQEGQQVTTVDIHFSMKFLAKMAEHFPALLNPFISQIAVGKPTTLFPHHLYASPQMMTTVREILLSLSRPQINAFAFDLLIQLLFVQAISCGWDLVSPHQVILRKELDAVHQIATVILEDLSTIKKIAELARMVGINERRVRGLFQRVYGTSIYDYWLTHRLEKGRQMVVSLPDQTITDIAYELGYGSAQSFEKAFKKAFHHSPSAIRQP